MTIDRKLAARAYKLQCAGMKGKAMGLELGVPTSEANQLAAVGSAYARLDKMPLTPPEMLLLRTLAAEERSLLAEGQTRSAESKWVSRRARKSSSWAAATAQKRLFDEHYDEKLGRTVRGRGLVHVAGNGYIWLTPAGWSVVLAMEEAEEQTAANAYDRGRRDMLNALLALNPDAAAKLAALHERTPDPVGRLPFDVVFWISEVAAQLEIEPRDGEGVIVDHSEMEERQEAEPAGLRQWRDDQLERVRDGSFLTRPAEQAVTEALPQDVIDLVIAARIVAYEDQSPEALRCLDVTVGAFAERVPWDDDPEALEAASEAGR